MSNLSSGDNHAHLLSADDFLDILRQDGVVRHPDATLTPLGGGVSSEIFRVDDAGDAFVVKRALPKLKVEDEWVADTSRNRYEQKYIEYVSGFLPQAVPLLRSHDANRGYFAMEYLGPEFTSWKQQLLRGEARMEHADLAATVLGRIHAHSAADTGLARQFSTTANFMQLRLDPYLLTTGRRHPDLRVLFETEAQRLASTEQCLVHGDFSPKNIMISASRWVLLDCEVAWYGDPSFDLAFLLTHLLLKGLYHAPRRIGLDQMARAFWRRYIQVAGDVIDAPAVEPRVTRLLLMLLLARIDGKSPVEYLTDSRKKDWVRHFVRSKLSKEHFDLAAILADWFTELDEGNVLQ